MIELPYPAPEQDVLVELMQNAIKAHIPVGHKLKQLVDHQNIGPDIDDEFMPCYRMRIAFETTLIEPKTWEGSD